MPLQHPHFHVGDRVFLTCAGRRSLSEFEMLLTGVFKVLRVATSGAGTCEISVRRPRILGPDGRPYTHWFVTTEHIVILRHRMLCGACVAAGPRPASTSFAAWIAAGAPNDSPES